MRYYFTLFVLLGPLVLTSCTPFVIGTTAATVAVTSMQERTVGTIIDDRTIWFKVSNALASKGFSKDISVVVNEGRILVTGNVQSSMDRVAVSKIIWEQNGVREVMNELQVEKPEQSFSRAAWITAQVRMGMLMKGSVKSLNYTIETYDGVVYLLGIAQSNDELKKVYEIARKISGVRQVVSYVRLKNSPMRKM